MRCGPAARRDGICRVLRVRQVWDHHQVMITQRLEARVRRDFGPSEADVVLTMLAELCPELPDFRKTRRGRNAF
jgi:hypothetical protein